jgi:hypothetical protein
MNMKKRRNMEDTYMIHRKFHDSAQFHTRSRMKIERRKINKFSLETSRSGPVQPRSTSRGGSSRVSRRGRSSRRPMQWRPSSLRLMQWSSSSLRPMWCPSSGSTAEAAATAGAAARRRRRRDGEGRREVATRLADGSAVRR